VPGRSGKARILIIDDHPIVRRGLAELIRDQPDLEVCGEAADATNAITLVAETDPDLVIVDISLAGTNGIEFIKLIKAKDPGRRMLVASMHDEVVYAERALRAGALGYVTKEAASHEIIRAIRDVLAGHIYLSRRASEAALRRIVTGAGGSGSPVAGLSDRELEVMEQIGRGVTTRQIAERLHLSVKTVETHRERIKTKLGLRNATELVRWSVQWVLEHS